MQKVSVNDMMKARDDRSARQQRLLAQFSATLLTFNMNIPGDEKVNDLIIEGFNIGNRMIRDLLKRNGIAIIHRETSVIFTGCESYYVVDHDPLELKKLLSELENCGPLGQLFDLDVISCEGRKIDRSEIGLAPRKCLICDQPAKLCGRSRSHSLAQLQAAVREILLSEVNRYNSEIIASSTLQSLLYELVTTPKPGLVDCNDSGSHRDMDIFTFSASTASLYPYLQKAAQLGFSQRTEDPAAAFVGLRELGRLAEDRMYSFTGGINTHKGAVFTMGILCCSYGMTSNDLWDNTDVIAENCRKLTSGLIEADLSRLTEKRQLTAGERLYLSAGITGIRGEAQQGYPSVFETGLPVLAEALKQHTVNQASLAALLALMARISDTNIISRTDLPTAETVRRQAAELLAEKAYLDEEMMQQYNRRLIEQNISPGGSADLLAASWLVYLLKGWKNG